MLKDFTSGPSPELHSSSLGGSNSYFLLQPATIQCSTANIFDWFVEQKNQDVLASSITPQKAFPLYRVASWTSLVLNSDSRRRFPSITLHHVSETQLPAASVIHSVIIPIVELKKGHNRLTFVAVSKCRFPLCVTYNVTHGLTKLCIVGFLR